MRSASHPIISLKQESLPGLCAIADAAHELSRAAGIDQRGAIFTRRPVADFMLDLVGYMPNRDLHKLSLLEPSFGNGDFLLPAVERLLAARARTLAAGGKVDSLAHCIRGVELHRETFESVRKSVIEMLAQAGFSTNEAGTLASAWLIHADYLLVNLSDGFDFVVGNPPYVRQELIPAPLLAEYRRRYSTLYDRADLYIPFIERSLSLLGDGSQLCFICSDRWMKNKYGGPLRAMISKGFRLRVYVDMVDADAFHSEVSAYPAITVIEKGEPGSTLAAKRPEIDTRALNALAHALRGKCAESPHVTELANVTSGSEPWILDSSDLTGLIRRIEEAFPTLEEAGCKVGIGVATGADKAFIGKFDELDVEPDRKLPLAMTRDLTSGQVVWRGFGVINPFTDEGPLVDLGRYPKLKLYLEERREQIAGRHVAQKAPASWYRTIDRITPSLALRPKLLIPDIKGEAQVVFENGKLYPHHNLYFLVSDSWDLRALQAVLLSNLTRVFIATYSTKMRGGYLRFQAQYLRRIRLPQWEAVSHDLRKRLMAAAERLDIAVCDEAVAELYSITQQERDALANQI